MSFVLILYYFVFCLCNLSIDLSKFVNMLNNEKRGKKKMADSVRGLPFISTNSPTLSCIPGFGYNNLMLNPDGLRTIVKPDYPYGGKYHNEFFDLPTFAKTDVSRASVYPRAGYDCPIGQMGVNGCLCPGSPNAPPFVQTCSPFKSQTFVDGPSMIITANKTPITHAAQTLIDQRQWPGYQYLK